MFQIQVESRYTPAGLTVRANLSPEHQILRTIGRRSTLFKASKRVETETNRSPSLFLEVQYYVMISLPFVAFCLGFRTRQVGDDAF